MINREILIKDLAREFMRGLEVYVRPARGWLEFKDNLEHELANFTNPIDKLIYLYEVHKVVTMHLDKHITRCPYKDNPENCVIDTFCSRAIFFTEQEISVLNPAYNFTILHPNLNSEILRDNLLILKEFPEAAKLYQSALNKLNEGRYERNLLDDLRLSLELLLKSILSNNNSLEKQTKDIGVFLKDRGSSAEVRNMLTTLINHYSQYQNNYVKHNDSVIKKEIELIVNLTSTFISFIIKIREYR